MQIKDLFNFEDIQQVVAIGNIENEQEMVEKFDALIADKKFPWKLRDVLPIVKSAGDSAGKLTEKGAKLLDPTGTLRAGIPVCPPEGDGDGYIVGRC